MTTQTVKIHEQLLTVSADLSPELRSAIAKNGPVELPLMELPSKKQNNPSDHPYQERPFADRLCRAVTGQQLSVRAAETIWARVVESAENGPLMDHFAQVDPSVLKSYGLSRAKVKTVGAIAQAHLNGQLNPTELSQLSHTERTQRLTSIWGIGQWTADMMGIFYFADADIWPDGDVTARKTLESLTSKRRKTIRTAARFAPYRSYLSLHMWQYADEKSH